MNFALEDYGLQLTSTHSRLGDFNKVQNTYIQIFQMLGALALLLGSAGLGVVVLRNVLERRGELALLQAVGFRKRSLHWLVFNEHGWFLFMGIGFGLGCSFLATQPALMANSNPFDFSNGTLAGIFISGLFWTWLATAIALRGKLLPALRSE
jgi:ABC-type antimicrobial peptide transport system permease subunit